MDLLIKKSNGSERSCYIFKKIHYRHQKNLTNIKNNVKVKGCNYAT